ncbi:hypothetical protein PPROV_000403600 [Pycnococcus provasolii]|uniref:U4/U6.U5 small nuclear ribonucleoprotein 27kDa protein domain-containing protein n=1 Tax=Pycnococcus provasolii TaxID=41880 RepID=A0A830HE00_9CHLO|nr:hypothetical protein PPROV_000403600 [Pycnococcus provasolii]
MARSRSRSPVRRERYRGGGTQHGGGERRRSRSRSPTGRGRGGGAGPVLDEFGRALPAGGRVERRKPERIERDEGDEPDAKRTRQCDAEKAAPVPHAEKVPADGGTAAAAGGDGQHNAATPMMAEEDEETLMARMMGFGSFSSTQGVHVNDATANASGVRLMTKRSARQYMNRRGGFNRPLPAERTGERVRRD